MDGTCDLFGHQEISVAVVGFITNSVQSRFRATCPTILTFNQLAYALDLGQLPRRGIYNIAFFRVSRVYTHEQPYVAHAYSRGFSDKQ